MNLVGQKTRLDCSPIGPGLDVSHLNADIKTFFQANKVCVYPDALLSLPQLDADDAEPKFDERECQDEYSEMHMPV